MPNIRLNVTVGHKGMLFDAAGTKAAAVRATTAANDILAQETVNRIHKRLGQVLQNPTGFYRSNVVVQRGSTYRGVTDSNVVYGGWLEGVDRRNKTMRFKGYHTFRLIKQEINKDKQQLLAPVVAKLIQELRG